jgi:ABC-type Fe3+/spermidine/putrescine transport system ATPase subunit
VALARALVLEPKLLLLDEPLSNLDAKLRIQVREDIREIQRRVGITTVFVTHDQDEASAIADRVGVMKDGRLEQYDTPAKIYREPATLSVAGFVGAMNLLRGRVSENGIIIDGVEVPCANVSARPEGDVDIAVRLEDVDLSGTSEPRARVTQAIPRGHFQEVHLQAPWGECRAFTGNDDAIPPEPSIAFRRALVYRDGHLLTDTHDRLPANLA